MIYDEDVDRACLRVQFEAKLVSEGLKECWACVVGREARRRGSVGSWRPLEAHIKSPAEPSLIKYRTV